MHAIILTEHFFDYQLLYHFCIVAQDGTKVDVLSLGQPEKNRLFQTKLIESMTKQIRFTLVNELAKEFGLPPPLVNEFMNEEFFDIEGTFKAKCREVNIMPWPNEGGVHIAIEQFKRFRPKFVSDIEECLRDAEDYTRRKYRVLKEVLKLQFELFGYLKRADVTVTIPEMERPNLPSELQVALLK